MPLPAATTRLRHVLWITFALVVGAMPARAGAAAVALPDTGLFAPVAAQFARGIDRDAAGDSLVARFRAALRGQDFAAAGPLAARLAGRDDAAARSAVLAWARVRDAAAMIDSLTRARLAGGDAGNVPELLAAARLAFDQLVDARAESLATRALAEAARDTGEFGARERSDAHVVIAQVEQRARKVDRSLAELRPALAEDATPDALSALAETLVRLGRTDEAISACEWGVRIEPDHEACHYWLGNGYARKNYTQLAAAYPRAFAPRGAFAAADAALARGERARARTLYAGLVRAHPGWADARVRLASLDWEDGRFAEARTGCVAALATCPEYGRAHAVLAKALESQRFAIDVHRAAYEQAFAATPMPVVPGIERFVANWKALSPRHQKRVALSMAPWRAFVPVLAEGGATYFIKPLYALLSETPGGEPLRDQRISYDSRLWDDVRGCGGYHTVTGIEDVERTIFARYNTVLHEFTHQVHGVLPADDARLVQECYRRAKARDDSTHDGFMSRYAGESVFEYLAEGANALYSPRRDAYDPREIVRERLLPRDPALVALLDTLLARTDVRASYPIAYSNGGDDRVGRGDVAGALPLYRKALALEPTDETVLVAYSTALLYGGRAAAAESVAVRAVATHASSGPARAALADARWFAGRGLDRARHELAAARDSVRAEDRYLVDLTLGYDAWVAGDTTAALAAYDSVLAYQADSPEGLRGKASVLALASHPGDAFALYDKAVQRRTGEADLRCDYARELLLAGRVAQASAQLDAAQLLDAENPTAEALRAWAAMIGGDSAAARRHANQALAWGPWCDLAHEVDAAITGNRGGAFPASRPAYVFRPKIAAWERVHVAPRVERDLVDRMNAGRAWNPSLP